MTKWIVAVVAVVTASLAGGAVGVYAFDASRADVIAQGVRIAGVDVGGMRADEARAVVERTLSPQLDRPLYVASGDRRWVASARSLRIRTNVAATVADALELTRDGNFLTRSYRDLTGREVSADLDLRVTYARRPVARLLAVVERALERPAKSARLVPGITSLDLVESKNGLEVRTKLLRRRLDAELLSLDGDRVVHVPTRTLVPEVTTDEVVEGNEYYLTISRSEKRLRLFVDLKLAKVYPIAVGRIGFETPAGLHEVVSKAVNPAWYAPEWAGNFAGKVIAGDDPRNPIKARWMEFYDGAGIHGTDAVDSLGTAASHGCIRMTIPDVIELYDRVPLGTPVYIV